MKFAPRYLLVAGLALAAAALAAYEMREASGPAAKAEVTTTRGDAAREPGTVRYAANAPQLSFLSVVPAAEAPIPVVEPVNGKVSYDENRTARISSAVAGRVVRIRAETGDRMAAGDVLLEIDAPDYAAADADFQKARADEVRKKLAYERAHSLYEHEVIARKDVESADADYRQAEAESRRASLRLRNLHGAGKPDASGRLLLRSPIAGIVADRQVNPGLEVRPDLPNPLYVITDPSRLWVLADVPERSLAHVHAGQGVSIETDAYPGRRFEATVDRLGLSLDPATRRMQVRCSVANPEGLLKPEMFARVVFLGDGGKKGLRVPNTALVAEGIHSFVFIETAPGVFQKRKVHLAVRGSENSFIDEGLAKSERVVTEGALLLNAEADVHAQ
ncbi:efflux RND transporter periplasmic adaptor subunit [Noviherbaspirillum galbum]|uniref:Efflux RND transporter periplasmic adaptor subunit n=1 Tax=Noviherbaspirillum galbum TaxID=2709383 RepID=A0A6B3SZD2_9BURK|nr:efflux RND transporter periplasmic adaptor subunit [Noviherbaspirillum galbum]NEX64602.1 efflux RND transporter periplasmic adaptor subunit [Noviherbaspirillum galbum]